MGQRLNWSNLFLVVLALFGALGVYGAFFSNVSEDMIAERMHRDDKPKKKRVHGNPNWRSFNGIIPAKRAHASTRIELEPVSLPPNPRPASVSRSRGELALSGQQMIWPVIGRVSSGFGELRRVRDGWAYGKDTRHSGLDIHCDQGDPIYAALSGQVTQSRLSGGGGRSGWGQTLLVESGNAQLRYAHLSRRLVAEGAYVEQGSLIGLCGHTGYVKGRNPDHLHFGVMVDGQWIDPMQYLPRQGAPAPGPQGSGNAQVRYSHYWPAWGGTNCARFVNGECVSRMSNGNPWQEWTYRAAACPRSLDGAVIVMPDGNEWVCMDRGGKIVMEDGIPWVDFMTDQAQYGHGDLVNVTIRQ